MRVSSILLCIKRKQQKPWHILVDYVSGPFEASKLHLFDGTENELAFFRSALRGLLVDRMLTGVQHQDAVQGPSLVQGKAVENNEDPKPTNTSAKYGMIQIC